MKAKQVIPVAILVIVGFALLGSWASTMAMRISAPSAGIKPYEVFAAWLWKSNATNPNTIAVINRSLAIGHGGVLLLLLVGAAMLAVGPRKELHGSLKWATTADVAKAGLFNRPKNAKAPGLILCKSQGKYLKWHSNEFFCLAAPTRSGKGVGFVIPNALMYPDSMVIYDPKLEIFKFTSGTRRDVRKNKVILFNPSGRDELSEAEKTFDMGDALANLQKEEEAAGSGFARSETKEVRSCRWNPFANISREPAFTAGEVMEMANILVPKGSDEKNAFFVEAAQRLFAGMALYMIETEEERMKERRASFKQKHPEDGAEPTAVELGVSSPALLFEMINFPQFPLTEALIRKSNPREAEAELAELNRSLASWIRREVLSQPVAKRLSETCKVFLSSFASGNDRTNGDILSTLVNPLQIFMDPVVKALTSDNDVDFRNLRKERTTIYVGVMPNDIARFSSLLNLFFSQLISTNMKQGLPEQNKELKHQCLLLIDEFPTLGKMPILTNASAYIAGYNLRLAVIFQTLSQLNQIYTQDGARVLLSNISTQLIYPSKQQQDATEYSNMIGFTTFKSKSRSRSFGKGGGGSESFSDQKRALLLPDEIKTMDLSKCVLLQTGLKPVLADKIKYYEDPYLSGLVKDHPPAWPEPLKVSNLLGAEEAAPQAQPAPQTAANEQEKQEKIASEIKKDVQGESNAGAPTANALADDEEFAAVGAVLAKELGAPAAKAQALPEANDDEEGDFDAFGETMGKELKSGKVKA